MQKGYPSEYASQFPQSAQLTIAAGVEANRNETSRRSFYRHSAWFPRQYGCRDGCWRANTDCCHRVRERICIVNSLNLVHQTGF